MKSRNMSIVFAAAIASAGVALALTQTAAAEKEAAKAETKPKPPITQICDPVAFTTCMSGGTSVQPPTRAACNAFSGCGKEQN